ncbi:unnamed protein product [Diplocarpon coronariae]
MDKHLPDPLGGRMHDEIYPGILLDNARHWRNLGGRLKLKRDGQVEIHVPQSFKTQRPAIAFDHDAYSESIETHSFDRGLPQLYSTTSPSVQKVTTDLRLFAGHPTAPKTIKESIDQEAPLITLHRCGCLLAARSNGRHGVSPVLGIYYDILQQVDLQIKDGAKRQSLAIEKLATGPLGMAFLGFRFLWQILFSPGFEDRKISVPQDHLSKLHARVLAGFAGKDEHECKPFISQADVLAAHIAAQSTKEQVLSYLHMQRQHVLNRKKLRLMFGNASICMLTVNNMAKIDFFAVLTFRLLCPSVLTSHLRVLGKDHAGVCWLTEMFSARIWAVLERALNSL